MSRKLNRNNKNNNVKKIVTFLAVTCVLSTTSNIFSLDPLEILKGNTNPIKIGYTKVFANSLVSTEPLDSTIKNIYTNGVSSNTFIIKKDGTVWVNGVNNLKEFIQGDPAPSSITSPTMLTINNVKSVHPCKYSVFYLKNDGTVWGQGINNYNIFGDGSSSNVDTNIIKQLNISGVSDVVVGYDCAFFIKNDGTVWASGLNDRGQLGIGQNLNNTDTITQVQISNVKRIVTGGKQTYFFKNDGTIWACGYNGYSLLAVGDNASTSINTPKQVTDISNVKDIATGTDFTHFLKYDGTVWAIGDNSVGQLGFGYNKAKYSLTQITSISGVSSISAGNGFTIFVKNDGTVWGTGYNSNGQLAIGIIGQSTTPVQSSITGVKSVITGDSHTIFLKTDGTIWGAGINTWGELGIADTNDHTTPVQLYTSWPTVDITPPTMTLTPSTTDPISGNVKIIATVKDETGGSGIKRVQDPDGNWVSASSLSNGSLSYTVSSNRTYTFSVEDNNGNKTTQSIIVSNIDTTKPTVNLAQSPTSWTNGNVTITATASDVGSGVKSITLPDNTVVNGSTANFTATSNNTYNFIIEDKAGNKTTQSIIVSNIDTTKPTMNLTQSPTSWTNGNVTITATASDVGSGVKSITLPDNTVVNGSTANFTATSNNTYTFIVEDNIGNKTTQSITVSNIDKVLPGISLSSDNVALTKGPVTIIATGSDSLSGVKRIKTPDGNWTNRSTVNYSVTTNGTYTFTVEDSVGNQSSSSFTISNIDNNLPDLDLKEDITTQTDEPITITATGSDAESGVAKIQNPDGSWTTGSTSNYKVSTNGTYTFVVEDKVGNQYSKSIEVINIKSSSLPVEQKQHNVFTSGGSNYTFIVKDDGTVWVCGSNTNKEFITIYSAPKAITTPIKLTNIDNVKSVYPSVSDVIYLKKDGTVWAQGKNSMGIFGNGKGANTDTNAVQQVNISNVSAIYVGCDSVFYVKNDGTVWACGKNGFGKLGVGNSSLANVRDITQVKISNVKRIISNENQTFFIKNDGTIWACGANSSAQLAVSNSASSISTPEQVTKITNVKDIATGSGFTHFLKYDGTVWGVGDNGSGQIGEGGKIELSPIQIPGIMDVSSIATCKNTVLCLKNDGTVWGIGENPSGVIGYGSITSKKIPTKASITDVDSMITGYSHVIYFKKDGTIWGAGNNYYGQLGITDTSNKTIPIELFKNLISSDETPPTITLTPNTTTPTNSTVILTATVQDETGGSGIKRVQTPDGNWIDGATITNNTLSYSVSTNGTYKFVVEDKNGNQTTQGITVSNIDNDIPSLSLLADKTTPTKGSVTLTAVGTDIGSGVKRIQTPDGKWVDGASATYSVSLNGIYKFVLEDKAGNQTTKSLPVNNIDSTSPTLDFKEDTTTPTRGSVIINVTGTDTGSGVTKIQNPNGSWTTGSTSNYKVSTNGTYTFVVEDGVGNQTTKNITISNIDNELPTLTVDQNPTTWTNGDVPLSINAKDVGSGVKRIQTPDGTWISGDTTTYTTVTNGTYKFVVEDNVGNQFTQDFTVSNIDKIPPTLTLSQNPITTTNGDVIITATGSDAESGVKSITLPDGTVVNDATTTFSVTSNGTYSFKITDKAGNETTKEVVISNIDKVNPKISLTQNPTAMTNGDVVVTIVGTDSESGIKSLTLPDSTVIDSSTSYTVTLSKTYTVTSNGTYIFKITDRAGNITIQSITVSNIDTDLPTLSLSANPTTYTKDTVTITAKANDVGSGVKRIQSPDGNWINSSSMDYTVSTNGTYSFVVEDNVGNVSTQNITISNIDITAPTLDLKPNINNWTNKNVVITAIGDDGQSGVKSITLPDGTVVNRNSATFTVTSNGIYKFTVEDNVGNITINYININNIDTVAPTTELKMNDSMLTSKSATIVVNAYDDISGIDSIILPDGQVVNGSTTTYSATSNGTYTFTAVDKAGNKMSSSIVVKNVIKINTTSGIDHFEYKLDGATIQDWTTYNGSLNIVNEGITTISARAVDKSGNYSNIATSLVKIDRSKPINGNVQIIVK